MAEYLRPDVYVIRENKVAPPIPTLATSTGAIVGVARRGTIGKPTLVTGWSEFVEKFAYGLDTPFIKDADLSYAVYGFFQNGGRRLYVVRTASDAAAKATVTLPATTGPAWTALDEGTWANSATTGKGIEIQITAGTGVGQFDITVKLEGVVVEKYLDVTNTTTDTAYFRDVINGKSRYISVGAGTLAAGVLTGLTAGDDGVSDIADGDYTGANGLESLSGVDDVNLVAIPGETSTTVLQAILDYCEGRKDCFGILDMPSGADVAATATTKASLAGAYGACYYPWGNVLDPIYSGKTRLCPPSGHVMGIYARTDNDRGVYKAPAGVDARVYGFVSMESRVTPGGIETLNPKGVNCIVSRQNQGLVVWGARIATPNLDRVYVSDMRFDIFMEESLYDGTQWSVFEPNDEVLWARLRNQIGAFLYNMWREGAIFGATADEAFFVKCDAELNTQETRDAGKVIAEVGYAKKKPAEFTIIRITQQTNGEGV